MKRFPWLNEIISIPLGLIAFWAFPFFAMQAEDNPAVWGIGALQIIVFSFAYFNIANGLAGITVKIVIPNVFNYKQEKFEEDFDNCTPFQRSALLLGWFAVYFGGAVACAFIL